MEDPNVNPASDNTEPNVDSRIAELEAQLRSVTKRYSDSSAEAQRLAQTVQQLQQSYQMPRQQVPTRKAWEEKLDAMGVPVDAITQAIDERADLLVSQRFEPMMRGIQARQTMVGKYKDYAKFESDIGDLLNSDREFQETYNRVFTADPAAALELAYFKLGDTRRRSRGKSEASDGEQVEAQIPSQRSGDARRVAQGNDQVVEEARKNYREQPNRRNAEALYKARIRGVITDEFLNQ